MTTRILLVEDDPDFRIIVANDLRRRGYEVLGATDWSRGLQLARGAEVNVIVSDMCLPGLDGRRALAEVRQTCPQLAVIFMSGMAPIEDILDGLQEGGAAFIRKPFEMEELCWLIDRTVKSCPLPAK